MGLFCSEDTIQLLNLLLNYERMQKHKCTEVSEHTHTHTYNTVFLCVFVFFILSFVFHYTHAWAQPGQILSNLCWSNLRVIVEIARVEEEVNQWLCREAVFPIKERADACIGLRLLTDSCKDEQWLSCFITWKERPLLEPATTTFVLTDTTLCVFYRSLPLEVNTTQGSLLGQLTAGVSQGLQETDGFACLQHQRKGSQVLTCT